MNLKACLAAALGAALVAPMGAAAHHSFAVFFDDSRTISIEGRVTSFRFTNPHALIVLEVRNADGHMSEWRVETNAPVVLARRGWTRTSLRAGDMVRIDGWPSRDGRANMRLRSASTLDGRAIGSAPFETNDH